MTIIWYHQCKKWSPNLLKVILYPCHGSRGNQWWQYMPEERVSSHMYDAWPNAWTCCRKWNMLSQESASQFIPRKRINWWVTRLHCNISWCKLCYESSTPTCSSILQSLWLWICQCSVSHNCPDQISAFSILYSYHQVPTIAVRFWTSTQLHYLVTHSWAN